MDKYGQQSINISAESLALLRKYRSLGVVWGIFTLCYNIILWVVITQDEWIGDKVSGAYGEVAGKFGLYSWCIGSECGGGVKDIYKTSIELTVATVFTALALLASCLSVMSTLLFCKYSSSFVYKLCGSLQIISGIFLLITLLVYPTTWSSDEVQTVCGKESGLYSLGICEIRWVFILAIIAVCDGFILGSLSITLSLNEVKCKDHYYRDLTSSDHLGYPVFGSTGALSQYGGYSGGHLGGHTNLGYSSDTISMYGSKPAINSAIYMTPHMEEDRYSTYSHVTGGSHNTRNNYYNLVL